MAEMRRCAGSAKFGIGAHDAPVENFPKQSSQKDGLGRMCRVHWNEYTTALRKAALERKGAEGERVTAKGESDTASEVDATAEASQPDDVTATTSQQSRQTAKRDGARRRAKKAGDEAQEGRAS